MTRRSFLTSLLATVASFLLGRCTSMTKSAYACIPTDPSAAPRPDLDLAKEFTTTTCLSREDVERVLEIAQERTCPVLRSSWENYLAEHGAWPDRDWYRQTRSRTAQLVRYPKTHPLKEKAVMATAKP